MKKILLHIAVAIFTISGCGWISPPYSDPDVLEYSVRTSVSGIKADIVYRNEENDIIKLEAVELPWVMPVTLNENFTGEIFFCVEADSSEVFNNYLSGTVSFLETNKLIDEDGTEDFTSSGILVGDKVTTTTDPAILTAASVLSIIDSNKLSLNADLFTAFDDPYYLYHMKTLTAEVRLNSELIESKVDENYKLLTCLVKTSIDR